MHHHKQKTNGATTKPMKRKAKTSTIDTLPEDVIVEIAARLVSCSPKPFEDLYSLQNTCKIFCVVSNDRIVKQCIALEREFPSLYWAATDRRMAILNECAKAGNTEAYFMLALINIFDKGEISTGVELLKKATCKGHKAALYLMNIVNLLFQELHLLTAVNSHDGFGADEIKYGHADDQFELCRQRVSNHVRHMSWNKWHAMAAGHRQQRCQNSECSIARGWDCRRNFCSDACRWNHEYIELCREM